MNDFEPVTKEFPDRFRPEELAIAVRNGVARLVIDDKAGAQEVVFNNGPTYDALTGQKLPHINKAPEGEAYGIGPAVADAGEIEAGGVIGGTIDIIEQTETEGLITDETEQAAVADLPGDDDPDTDEDGDEIEEEAFDDDQAGEIEAGDYLDQLDDVTVPPIVTEEDLTSAGLSDGPDFTHSEALLATLAAANAAAPAFEVEADLAEALYEFGSREDWPKPETFYLQAMFLVEAEAGSFAEIDAEIRVWFTVFAETGRALYGYAFERRKLYDDKVAKLAHELSKTRFQQKLADRKRTKQAKRKSAGELRRRAAEKWKMKQQRDGKG